MNQCANCGYTDVLRDGICPLCRAEDLASDKDDYEVDPSLLATSQPTPAQAGSVADNNTLTDHELLLTAEIARLRGVLRTIADYEDVEVDMSYGHQQAGMRQQAENALETNPPPQGGILSILAKRNDAYRIENARLRSELEAKVAEANGLRVALEPFADALDKIPEGLRSTLRIWNGEIGIESDTISLDISTDTLEQARKALGQPVRADASGEGEGNAPICPKHNIEMVEYGDEPDSIWYCSDCEREKEEIITTMNEPDEFGD